MTVRNWPPNGGLEVPSFQTNRPGADIRWWGDLKKSLSKSTFCDIQDQHRSTISMPFSTGNSTWYLWHVSIPQPFSQTLGIFPAVTLWQGLHPNMAPAIPILIYLMLGCCLSDKSETVTLVGIPNCQWSVFASKKSVEKTWKNRWQCWPERTCNVLGDNQLPFGSHTFQLKNYEAWNSLFNGKRIYEYFFLLVNFQFLHAMLDYQSQSLPHWNCYKLV